MYLFIVCSDKEIVPTGYDVKEKLFKKWNSYPSVTLTIKNEKILKKELGTVNAIELEQVK